MLRRKLKLKITTKGKSYQVSDSPLFKLASKRKLAQILNVDLQDLPQFQKDEGNYQVFEQVGKLNKARLIEHPKESLDKVHTRIASLLCRLAIPDYVHSGVKKKSYVSNASEHKESAEVLTLDIKSYYQNTTWKHIHRLFKKTFYMSADVAYILADICCYSGHVPTGSRVSMPLAFWANFQMFEEINETIKRLGLKMSVYVDDITISGAKIPNGTFRKIEKIIRNHNQTVHPKKTKHYKNNEPKVVTGIVLDNGALRIKNSQHWAIKEDIDQWLICKNDRKPIPATLLNRILGRLNALSVVEPSLRDKARTLLVAERNSKNARP